MSKIGIVIDPHLTARHRCRKDNFLLTALQKLDYVASQNDYVIICGDLFHLNSNPDYIFYSVCSLLNKHKGKFIAIPGNHDLLHNNFSALDHTTIGSLALTGALDLKFKEFSIGNANFVVSHVKKDLDKIPIDVSNSKVLLGHNYVELPGAPDESFTKDELRKLNYKLVFLGHDHKPYEEELLGESILIRMGNLTRIDTQPYNISRKIFYYQLDSDTLEYEKKEVPTKPIEEVYIEGAFKATKSRKEDLTFIKIGDALSKFKKKTNEVHSLNKKLIKIGCTQKEIDYIKGLHELCNVTYF